MIHYRLVCASGHDFEGWFRDCASFEQQSERRLLTCPVCGGDTIRRGLMAPAVRTSLPVARPAMPPPALPDVVRAELQKLRARVERDCEDMGDRFADEAIRMHHGDVEERGIYGSTTDSDRDALADAGVEVVAIPWLKPADA